MLFHYHISNKENHLKTETPQKGTRTKPRIEMSRFFPFSLLTLPFAIVPWWSLPIWWRDLNKIDLGTLIHPVENMHIQNTRQGVNLRAAPLPDIAIIFFSLKVLIRHGCYLDWDVWLLVKILILAGELHNLSKLALLSWKWGLLLTNAAALR